MNAVEFIRKFGWDHTKYLLKDTELSEFAIHSNCAGKHSMDTVSVSDLKRYVDAYEFVQDLYGLDKAKEYAESPYTAPEIVEPLKQAIALVDEI